MNNPKQQLRRTILAARDALSPDYRIAASQRILQTLDQQPAYHQAKTILGHIGFGSEINTTPLLAQLEKDHKIAVLPRVNRATRTLSLHQVIVGEPLIPGPWGILEPAAEWPRISLSQIDLILIPGVAFTPQGHRLGYGGGYYDTLLATSADEATRPSSRQPRIALAFECQITTTLPTEAHDQRIDYLITENQTITCP